MATNTVDVDPLISPNKRLKTLNLISASPKGKQKLDETEEKPDDEIIDSDEKCCGICLSEEGKAMRGCIDCCEHYFCFVCIMEWAKVESRCPMCKGRFSTIYRPPKEGSSVPDRGVLVPIRDQVYPPFGLNSLGPDPYLATHCVVCQGSQDESVLLLCDLCDSAAHTYCVGLGSTVPEGDWFCTDCAISKAEHAGDDVVSDNIFGRINLRRFEETPSEAHISIFDIVRDADAPEDGTCSTTETSYPSLSPETDVFTKDASTEQIARNSVANRRTEAGARTLHHCRNVHKHIRALRENWNGLRSGSLRFSSSSMDLGSQRHQKEQAVHCYVSEQQALSSASSCQQSTTQDGSSHDKVEMSNSHDINKAWRMMDIAKSVERASQRTHNPCLASGHQDRGRAPNQAKNTTSNGKPILSTNLGRIGSEKHNNYHSLHNKDKKSVSFKHGDQKLGKNPKAGIFRLTKGFPGTHSQGKTQIFAQVDIHHDGRLSGKSLYGAFSNTISMSDGSARLTSASGHAPGACYTPFKMEPNVPSSAKSEIELPQAKNGVEKNCFQNHSTEDCDAKSEIQSLVKLNLKLLSRNKKLEVSTFKEVARLSTHAIMAACGFEHPRPGARTFPASVCCHVNQTQQLRMSTLMPSSCRECFYVFVRDVVSSIMCEKIGGTNL
ncbi:Zinc finger, PHD-finger [Dillenia turbinata]|uniref:Zinc finger, PHD-finger n=1 Tax=Dillenia turbinata TaxID=194707 RepID=A0AAN8V073_9MAGN